MLDLTSIRGKIVDAALRLAASKGWDGLSLDQIANEAGVGLAQFRKEFSSKAHILAAYTRSIDDAVLAKISPADAALAPRDRLFDVLMTRFELMAPHKAGLARIKDDLQYRPGESLAQFGVAARSLYWMLAAAGIDAEGTRGALRLPGIMGIYARVFDIWLEDTDPGLARTMAALDSRLRRGERVMQRTDDIGAAAKRMFNSIVPSRRERASAGAPETAAAPAPSPNGHTPGGGEPGPAPAL
ncbi:MULTISPECIES: TetR/AcrR family transcriptional regulator [Rhodomicrobium]|uniref:TetR/AcrR family transcriptional regulator n=1 Tax=Rhodomicrobium TaxID=1068 RepID=UPI000B4A57A3|nr:MULTISPECIES: TetR/AcrR family transcriptional regulator [Rhodomicrobium]